MAAFLLYATLVIVAVVIIIVQYAPKYGQTHIITYIGVCSLVGSIGVGTQLSSWSLAFHFYRHYIWIYSTLNKYLDIK